MPYKPTIIIPGMKNGVRVDTRTLEAAVQAAIRDGHRCVEIHAYGQHGIGGRLWKAGEEEISIRVLGPAGQRVGAMGFPNATIDVFGPCSDDVGWLNAGARIIVRGNATNGVALFQEERLGAVGDYYSSPVAAHGKICVASQSGVVTVLAATDSLTILAQNKMGEPVMATPAIVGQRLYLRTKSQLYAFGE